MADASTAIAALLDEGPARDLIRGEQVHAPHLIDCEVANGLRGLARRGAVRSETAFAALGAWVRLGVIRHPLLANLGRVWQLRDNLSAYDASYVALAEQLACTLVTGDGRLGRAAGIRCPVTTVPS